MYSIILTMAMASGGDVPAGHLLYRSGCSGTIQRAERGGCHGSIMARQRTITRTRSVSETVRVPAPAAKPAAPPAPPKAPVAAVAVPVVALPVCANGNCGFFAGPVRRLAFWR